MAAAEWAPTNKLYAHAQHLAYDFSAVRRPSAASAFAIGGSGE